jgi:hypothetical protein
LRHHCAGDAQRARAAATALASGGDAAHVAAVTIWAVSDTYPRINETY